MISQSMVAEEAAQLLVLVRDRMALPKREERKFTQKEHRKLMDYLAKAQSEQNRASKGIEKIKQMNKDLMK